MTMSTVPARVVNRLTATLFISESLFSASMIAGFTLMSIIAADLSGRDSAAGWPNTVMLLGQAAAAFPIGWLMGRMGRRVGLGLGYALAVGGGLLAAFSIGWGSFLGFCLGAGLMGMGRGAGQQSRFAAAEIQAPDRRAKAIGLIVFAGTVGAVAGPMLVNPAGLLAEQLGFAYEQGPYFLGAGFFALAVLLTTVVLRPDPMEIGRRLGYDDDGDDAAAGGRKQGRPLGEIFAAPPVRLAVASMVVGQLVMVMIMVITPLHMNRNAYSGQEISWVIMAHTLGMFGLSALTGWLIDRFGRESMIVAGALVLAVSAIIAPVAYQLIFLIVSLFLLGLGWNFCFIAGSSLLSDALAPRERGRAQGANDMLVALASATGSFSTGGLFALGSMFLVSMVGLGISVLLVLAGMWHLRGHPAPAPAGD